jgi:Ni2+-binding GTPase involved in maturation of urease and hydrogenase
VLIGPGRFMRGKRKKIVVIYGGGSSSGKTTLAEALLRSLRDWAAVKITPSPVYSSIAVFDPSTDPLGKDTARLAGAGAGPVLHVRSPADDLEETLRRALEMIPDDRSILIEGRGARGILNPDLSILVWRQGLGEPKGSLEEMSRGADLIVLNGDDPGPGGGPTLPGTRWERIACPVLRGCLKESPDPELVAGIISLLEEEKG